MRESINEAVERLETMLDDTENLTWDLSPNDKAAIRAVLEERRPLLVIEAVAREVVRYLRDWPDCCQSICLESLLHELGRVLDAEEAKL